MLTTSLQKCPAIERAYALKGGRTIPLKITEQDIAVPLISLRLAAFYQLGDLIYVEGCGRQIEAALSVLWLGQTRLILGAAMTLLDYDLILPLGWWGG
jgi:hypothetical protein